jgi:ribosomal protein L11 methylase PrmA
LRSGGTAIFSGMEPSEAEAFRPPLVQSGFVITRELIDEGWWAVAATKP